MMQGSRVIRGSGAPVRARPGQLQVRLGRCRHCREQVLGLANHESRCKSNTVQCAHCGEQVQAAQIERHSKDVHGLRVPVSRATLQSGVQTVDNFDRTMEQTKEGQREETQSNQLIEEHLALLGRLQAMACQINRLLPPKQRADYLQRILRLQRNIMHFVDLVASGRARQAAGLTLEDIEELAPGRVAVSGGEDCLICFEGVAGGDRFRRLGCSHAYHSQCVDRWLQTNPSCPACRYQLKPT